MSAYIAKVATGDIPPGVAVSAGFAVGLVLFVITYLINTVAAHVVLQIKTGSSHKVLKLKTFDNKESNVLLKSISTIKESISNVIYRIRTTISKVKNRLKKPKVITLKKRYLHQRIGITLVGGSIVIAAVFLVILLGNILFEGIGGLNPSFLTSFPSRFPDKAGIFPIIMGSVYLLGLTLIFAAPLGVGAAVYLNEFARDTRYTRFLRRIIQNLAGVPSIVFGLVGLTIFVRLFGFGPSLISGSLTLTIMVLPIVVVTTEESLRAIPEGFREAARGVGSTKWQTVRHHVLPNAIPGILTGIILALSRAIGETAPLLFIAAVFTKTVPSNIFDGFLALPTQIFYWTTQPQAEFHILAASTIIILLVILLAMNAVAIIIRQRAQAKRKW
ncbi:MAG: phosphate ABC transporter permease PstA [Candidatus Thermoplasmatota archaeon]|nr:phosphate ABC transporter permease PstA [Candidatus Thermoplasmatota archaeon]